MRRLALFLAPFTILLSGCATAANLFYFHEEEGGKRMYGGVIADLGAIRESATQGRARPIACAALDLPFSFVGDTLTLPVTFCAELSRTFQKRDAIIHATAAPEQFPHNPERSGKLLSRETIQAVIDSTPAAPSAE